MKLVDAIAAINRARANAEPVPTVTIDADAFGDKATSSVAMRVVGVPVSRQPDGTYVTFDETHRTSVEEIKRIADEVASKLTVSTKTMVPHTGRIMTVSTADDFRPVYVDPHEPAPHYDSPDDARAAFDRMMRRGRASL